MTYEILEHTADVGIEARGGDCEEAFAQVGQGLATLLGAWFPGEGKPRQVRVHSEDREALLAAWADELLYLHEVGDFLFGRFDVVRVTDREVEAEVLAVPRAGRELEGEGIKAATLHGIRVSEEAGGWLARIYLDV